MTKRETELLRRSALFVLAGEWPWEPEKSGEREALERAAERLSSSAVPDDSDKGDPRDDRSYTGQIAALKAALRDVIRESDRNTDAYIRARALLAAPREAGATRPMVRHL